MNDRCPDGPSLADPDRVRALLNGSGYDDIDFEAVDEPIEFGSTAEDAFGFMQTLGIHDLGEREGARASTPCEQWSTRTTAATASMVTRESLGGAPSRRPGWPPSLADTHWAESMALIAPSRRPRSARSKLRSERAWPQCRLSASLRP